MTTGLDLSDLDRFATVPAATPVRGGKGSQKTWSPPAIEEFATGSVLAWDQSLSATGWVHLTHQHGPIGLTVESAGTLQGDHGTEGWENVILSAETLEAKASELMERISSDYCGHIVFVNEAPPTGGGKFLKPELSLVCAYALRQAAKRVGIPIAPMVAPQTHKRFICGNGNAKKPVEHAALKELSGVLPIVGYEQITNEAKRDAICVGMAHLLREGSNGRT